MQNKKGVLVIGLEPTSLDYSSFQDLNAEKVMECLRTEQDRGRGLGYDIDICLINPNGTDMHIISRKLSQKQFDCIVIGAGIRVLSEYFLLFEKVINLVHQNAPASIICFNTNPSDTIEAIKRWI
ncbi:MAG: hypothetical protein FJ356_02700 [Thaumarchaeota archaeon]|nr:hypothetical protein [Nitrososphaerota archaeon]